MEAAKLDPDQRRRDKNMGGTPDVFGIVAAGEKRDCHRIVTVLLSRGRVKGAMPRIATQPVKEKDLHRWRLVEAFRTELAEVLAARGGLAPDDTWADPRRTLELGDYLSLHLFGLFNPVVATLRGLSAASRLDRVQDEVCAAPASLGTLSEAQAVVEPALLEAVFARLHARTPPGAGPARLTGREVVLDSTVWPALPRMAWAFWRTQHQGQNAVRLHLEFDLAKGTPGRAELTPAKLCEQAWWRRHARAGTRYIGDRNFGKDYRLLGELTARGVEWVVRLHGDARWLVVQEEELSAVDRAAGVTWAGQVRLGVQGDGPAARVVQVLGAEETLLIATNVGAAELPPELVADRARLRGRKRLPTLRQFEDRRGLIRLFLGKHAGDAKGAGGAAALRAVVGHHVIAALHCANRRFEYRRALVAKALPGL